MKKLSLFVLLFSISVLGAHAADEFDYLDKQVRPPIKMSITLGNKIVNHDESPDDNNDAEKAEPVKRPNTYVLNLGDITLGADLSNCKMTWRADVTNTGTVASPEYMKVSPKVVYDMIESEGMNDFFMSEYSTGSIEAGQSYRAEGAVSRRFSYSQDLVVELRDDEDVLETKSVAIPLESDFVVVPGEVVVIGNQISVPLANEGAAPVSSLMVVFKGRSNNPPSHFRIGIDAVSCIPPGETSSVSFTVPARDHVGYRVMVYRTGGSDHIVTRDYTK